MPRPCSICESKTRNEIDRCLLETPLTGITIRGISRKFNVSEDALSRHKDKHLSEPVADVLATMQQAREEALLEVKAEELEDIKENAATTISGRLEQAKDFFEQLKILRERASMALEKAEEAEDQKTVLLACRELRDTIRIWAELEGRLATQPTINILVNPEWIKLRTTLLEVLQRYPDVLEAVTNVLP